MTLLMKVLKYILEWIVIWFGYSLTKLRWLTDFSLTKNKAQSLNFLPPLVLPVERNDWWKVFNLVVSHFCKDL